MKRLALLMLCGACLSRPAAATAARDTLLWTSASIRYKPHKKLKLELSQHLRLDQNLSQVERTMPELELTYRPAGWLDLGIGYRYIFERTKNGDLEPAHRYHGQLGLEHELGPVEISYRLRYQEKHEEDEFDWTARIRNKLSAQLDTDTAFTPLISAEHFLDTVERPTETTRYRLGIGTKIKLSKPHRLTVRYLYQADQREPLSEHILSLKYQYRIPRRTGASR